MITIWPNIRSFESASACEAMLILPLASHIRCTPRMLLLVSQADANAAAGVLGVFHTFELDHDASVTEKKFRLKMNSFPKRAHEKFPPFSPL